MSPEAGLEDATPDADEDLGAPDLGPSCDPACSGASTCCDGDDGPVCATLTNDVANCGGCGSDCVAENRGTDCMDGQCVCGLASFGCGGTQTSFCCPPRGEGERPYCADLANSGLDCGACDDACAPSQADRCNLGICVCGNSRRDGCAGTPEDFCCGDEITGDAACVDTQTDELNCGACGTGCRPGERCELGTCTTGEACPGGCATGEVCCGGECCGSAACISAEEGCRS